MEAKSAHSRLLYCESTVGKLHEWPNLLNHIDKTLTMSSKFHVAGDDLTFYFFSFNNKEESVYWQGREVVGFESVLPQGLKTFDSFSGDMYSFEYSGVPANREEVFTLAKEYRSQIPERQMLANTWSMRLRGIDHGVGKSGGVRTPFTLFQFFKKT